MDAEYIRSEILRAQSELSAAYFPKLLVDVPTWDEFIQHLNRQVQIRPPVELNSGVEVAIGRAITRSDVDFYFYTTGGDLPSEIPAVGKAQEFIRGVAGDILQGGPHPVGVFINFADEGFKVPAHGDNRETIFWQCIGTTTWNIYTPKVGRDGRRLEGPGSESTLIGSYEMGPGDVLYIGHWVEHEVIVKGPRAGIAFNALE